MNLFNYAFQGVITSLSITDYSALTVPDRLHERFRPFYEQKSSETARNVEVGSRKFRKGERSGTLDGLYQKYDWKNNSFE